MDMALRWNACLWRRFSNHGVPNSLPRSPVIPMVRHPR